MKLLSLFSGCGGMDLGLHRAGMEVVCQVEKMKFALKILTRHWPKVPKHTDILTFCVRDGHVKTIQSLVRGKDMQEKKAGFGYTWQGAYDYLTRAGLLEKMFPGFYPSVTEKTFAQLSPSCRKSGMAFRGEYLTVNTSESPKDAAGCSLSDILEVHVHPKYYLSKKAVAGMIRRTKNGSRSGDYVFYQEINETKQHVKIMSLQQLEQMITIADTRDMKNQTLSQKHFLPKNQNCEKYHLTEEILSDTHLEQEKEASLDGYGKKLILRRLTVNEKEKLQGFPMNWSHPEGVSLVMRSQ